MKFSCPHCNKQYDHPNATAGKKAKCRKCKNIFIIPITINSVESPSPLPVEKIVPTKITLAQKTLLTAGKRMWNNAPLPFRNAFLGTLGVLSAIMITWMLYGKATGRTSQINTMENITSEMAQLGLFPDAYSPNQGIFRGRNLKEYRFLPDANYNQEFLSVWVDDYKTVVGASTKWIGDKDGSTFLLLKDDIDYVLRVDQIHKAFNFISGFQINRISKANFTKNKNLYIGFAECSKWSIQISKFPLNDNKNYLFSITAQNW